MLNKKLKKIPKFETDEEFGQFVLDHDMADYIDWSKSKPVVFPNLKRSEHIVPLQLPDEEYAQLSELAAARKKSLADTIRQLLAHSLKELRANPSARI